EEVHHLPTDCASCPEPKPDDLAAPIADWVFGLEVLEAALVGVPLHCLHFLGHIPVRLPANCRVDDVCRWMAGLHSENVHETAFTIAVETVSFRDADEAFLAQQGSDGVHCSFIMTTIT